MEPGKITEAQCKRSVLSLLPEYGENVVQGAGIGRDYGAIRLPEGSRVATSMATCSLSTKTPERYAFHRACNKLETSGASLQAIMANILLPARGSENRIKEIVRTLAGLCRETGAAYIGGHTELLEDLRKPVITVVAYGGQKEYGYSYSIGRIRPGDSLLMVGYAATEATVLLANDRWEELNTRYTSEYLEGALALEQDLSLRQALGALDPEQVSYIHDGSTGGIFAALWEVGEGAGCGVEVRLKDIPIRQETVEVCEYFDVNPYMAASGGCAVLVTAEPTTVAEQLAARHIPVQIIGKITDRRERVIINNDDEVRYLTPPKGDDIYKIYRNRGQAL